MSTTIITVEGMLQPDGVTLQLEKKLALPPGRVTVTVQPTMLRTGPKMLDVLERIHRDRRLRGQSPMTEEQMATEIAQMRDEDGDYEERWRQIWSHSGTKPDRTDNL